MKSRLGEIVLEARNRKGLSQDQLAEVCGVSKQAISKVENQNKAGKNLLRAYFHACLGVAPLKLKGTAHIHLTRTAMNINEAAGPVRPQVTFDECENKVVIGFCNAAWFCPALFWWAESDRYVVITPNSLERIGNNNAHVALQSSALAPNLKRGVD